MHPRVPDDVRHSLIEQAQDGSDSNIHVDEK